MNWRTAKAVERPPPRPLLPGRGRGEPFFAALLPLDQALVHELLVLLFALALAPTIDLHGAAEEADDGVDERRNGGLSGAVPRASIKIGRAGFIGRCINMYFPRRAGPSPCLPATSKDDQKRWVDSVYILGFVLRGSFRVRASEPIGVVINYVSQAREFSLRAAARGGRARVE